MSKENSIVWKARSDWKFGIEKLIADRVTEKSVWVNGVRSARISDRVAIFDTFGEAKGYLVNAMTNRCLTLEDRLNDAADKLREAESINESDCKETRETW